MEEENTDFQCTLFEKNVKRTASLAQLTVISYTAGTFFIMHFMDTSKAKDTAHQVDKELTTFLAPVEKEAIDFFSRFPHLPKEIVNVLVLIVPYFAVISVILMGIAILAMTGISIIGLPLWFFAAPGGLFGGIIYTIFTIIGWALTLASIPGLFARAKTGWNFMFYGVLWSALMNLLSFNLISMVFSLLLSGYFLFEMRDHYTLKLPGIGQTSTKTTV